MQAVQTLNHILKPITGQLLYPHTHRSHHIDLLLLPSNERGLEHRLKLLDWIRSSDSLLGVALDHQ